jgi:hypothetical protein
MAVFMPPHTFNSVQFSAHLVMSHDQSPDDDDEGCGDERAFVRATLGPLKVVSNSAQRRLLHAQLQADASDVTRRLLNNYQNHPTSFRLYKDRRGRARGKHDPNASGVFFVELYNAAVGLCLH